MGFEHNRSPIRDQLPLIQKLHFSTPIQKAPQAGCFIKCELRGGSGGEAYLLPLDVQFVLGDLDKSALKPKVYEKSCDRQQATNDGKPIRQRESPDTCQQCTTPGRLIY
jgi:hypothetical protein